MEVRPNILIWNYGKSRQCKAGGFAINLFPKCRFAEIEPPKEKDEPPKGFFLSAVRLFVMAFDCGVVEVVFYIFLKYCKASTTSSSVLRKEG